MNNGIWMAMSTMATCLSLFACSSEYPVTRVEPGPINPILEEAGIYYTLPKTEIIVQVPVTHTVISIGRLHGNFDQNVAACRANRPDDTEFGEPIVESKYKIGTSEILTRPLPDPRHRYRIDVTADFFSSFSHSVEVSEDNLLKSATSTVRNVGAEIALATVKTLASVAISSVGAAVGAEPTCVEVLNAAEGMEAYDNGIAVIKADRERILLQDGLQSPEGSSLDKALVYLDTQEETLKRRFADAIRETQRITKKSDYTLVGVIMPDSYVPIENGELDWELISNARSDDESGLLDDQNLVTRILENVEKLQEVPQNEGFRVSVKPVDVAYSVDCGENPELPRCQDTKQMGYRYRVPIRSEVVFSSNGSPMIRAEVKVAQFGLLARLPEKIGGLEGNIDLQVYTETGALKKVTVGAKPLPSETITEAGTIVTDTFSKIRDAETEKLRRKKEKLQLKSDIKKLEEDLKGDDPL